MVEISDFKWLSTLNLNTRLCQRLSLWIIKKKNENIHDVHLYLTYIYVEFCLVDIFVNFFFILTRTTTNWWWILFCAIVIHNWITNEIWLFYQTFKETKTINICVLIVMMIHSYTICFYRSSCLTSIYYLSFGRP